MYDFEFASASVAGTSHRDLGRNNQDTVLMQELPGTDYRLAIVADGCGSSQHSEVGSYLLTRLALKRFQALLSGGNNNQSLEYADIERALRLMSQDLWSVAQTIGQADETSTDQIVLESMLSTMLIVLLGPDNTHFVVLGDGVVIIDGVVMEFDADNAPPYLAYAACSRDYHRPFTSLPVQYMVVPTEQLSHFVIASDGLSDLLAAEGITVPGSTREQVPAISQLWTADAFFANEHALRRYLTKINRTGKRLDRSTGELQTFTGLLSDDTSIIVGRRANT